jgi:hypothetical protein
VLRWLSPGELWCSPESSSEDKVEKKIKKKEKVSWTFYILIHLTQAEEVVLSNVFLKRLHLH